MFKNFKKILRYLLNGKNDDLQRLVTELEQKTATLENKLEKAEKLLSDEANEQKMKNWQQKFDHQQFLYAEEKIKIEEDLLNRRINGLNMLEQYRSNNREEIVGLSEKVGYTKAIIESKYFLNQKEEIDRLNKIIHALISTPQHPLTKPPTTVAN